MAERIKTRLTLSARRIAQDFVAFVLLATAVGLGAGVTFAGVALLFSTASATEPAASSQTYADPAGQAGVAPRAR